MIPQATYRLQFNRDFTFSDAAKIVDYLSALGISHIYASPIFKTRPGSMHGYDIVNHNQLNPELGTPQDFEDLIKKVQEHNLKWIQDVVPNHMAYGPDNTILMSVLEHGEHARFFKYFDIDWQHPYESMQDQVLAPFLGDYFGRVLEKGEIKLIYEENGLAIQYYQLKFPVKIESYAKIFIPQLNKLGKKLGRDHQDFIRIQGLISLVQNYEPAGDEEDWESQIKFIKSVLWELYTQNEEVRQHIDKRLSAFNGESGQPESFNDLEELLAEQHYRLSFWKVAAEEINYRRFFNINELICLKVEDQTVFERSHELIRQLITEGHIQGLRIDHIDGLYDPGQYLVRLREQAPNTYLIIEKILAPDEDLPDWPIQGTTGYDFLYFLNGVLCDQANRLQFDKLYSKFIGYTPDYEQMVTQTKRLMIGKEMGGDVDNLAQLTKSIFSAHRHTADMTHFGLRRAIVEVMAHFLVYRTYQSMDINRTADEAYIRQAVDLAIIYQPGLKNELEYIRKFLLLEFDDFISEEDKQRWVRFVMRFQQFTGPLMAKGFEDTFFYTYNRLVSQNEVGGEPGTFGVSKQAFYDFLSHRCQTWPQSMNTTATHDTKRGEDTRVRINVLSEMPQEWNRMIRHWRQLNRRKKKVVGKDRQPDLNDEYFLYQTMLGCYPFSQAAHESFVRRLSDYMIKAVREAKVHTAWIKPDEVYEQHFLDFIQKITKPTASNHFWQSFINFQEKIAAYGIYNSLTQLVCKLAAPGVPDIYQGTESWDLSLVDPDNRRPVDYGQRQAWLQEIQYRTNHDHLWLIKELLANKEDGRIKMFILHKSLQGRREHAGLFAHGRFFPVEVKGELANHVLAFGRQYKKDWLLVVVPRLLSRIINPQQEPLGKAIWKNTQLDVPADGPKEWYNLFTEQSVSSPKKMAVAKILHQLPVALLLGQTK